MIITLYTSQVHTGDGAEAGGARAELRKKAPQLISHNVLVDEFQKVTPPTKL